MSGHYRGFTLVELMVTIAVAAILLSVGVPSLKSLYDGYRVKSEISRIEQTLAFARNQAISYGMGVSVAKNGANWSDGLRVFVTSSDKTLKVVDGFSSHDVVTGADVTFQADGLSSGEATFTYCNNSSDCKGVKVSSSGMIRYTDS
ncbi:GspH/FimT family pseudopilin [Shewanella yunxiaonensis]|uniref:Type II secretion system protein H n=1 Tax=Shewanella yunxiaonensis TaxID=2829809 RepID=A0ABX7YV28_9GAMM|nr:MULTISPECIES: GspH/FimT family pseudopilin [Shewanella]MDF0532760.1 GspH/FimT family pseudopilin [Shewanella sp. A32]QUN06648.1 GspH/FimT family pseudopilin [Shewanella yunxiaonensis]